MTGADKADVLCKQGLNRGEKHTADPARDVTKGAPAKRIASKQHEMKHQLSGASSDASAIMSFPGTADIR